MTLEDRLERLAGRTPPGDPVDVMAAALAQAGPRPDARSPRFLPVAAAVVAVIALAGGAFALVGGDDNDSVTAAGPDGDPAQPQPSCEDITRFADSLNDTGIDYDHQASSSPQDLAGRSDTVFSGTLNGTVTQVTDQEYRMDYVGFEVDVADQFKTDGERTLDRVTVLLADGIERRARYWADLIPPSTPVLVFGHAPAGSTPDASSSVVVNGVEGIVTGCENGPPIGLVGAQGDWPTFRTLAEIEAALTSTPVDADDQGGVEGSAARTLPSWVPDGYRLAWVDTPAIPPSETDRFALHERPHDYAYGYQNPGAAELEVRVMLGARIGDPQAVANGWNDLAEPTTVGGRPAVGYTDDGGYTRMLVEVDGGVAMITTHPLGESYPDGLNPAMPPREDVDRFAASVAAVGDADWDAALSSSDADVASTFGPKGGAEVVEGEGWSLVHGEFRAPLSVRHEALWVDFGGAMGGAAGSGVFGENDAWHVAIAVHDSTRVAWGILPAGAATVEVTIDGQLYTTGTVALDDTAERAFAVDVSRSTGNGTFQATSPTGGHVASGPVDIE